MTKVIQLRVIGQLNFSGKVSLISEEALEGINKGSVVHTVTRTTYKNMSIPKSVRIFINEFGDKRIEAIIQKHEKI